MKLDTAKIYYKFGLQLKNKWKAINSIPEYFPNFRAAVEEGDGEGFEGMFYVNIGGITLEYVPSLDFWKLVNTSNQNCRCFEWWLKELLDEKIN